MTGTRKRKRRTRVNCDGCGGTGLVKDWKQRFRTPFHDAAGCPKCKGKGWLPDADDLLLERGKGGLHRLIVEYFEVEGCEVCDLTKGERQLKRNPHGKGKADLLVVIPAGREIHGIGGAVYKGEHLAFDVETGKLVGHTCAAMPIALEIKRPRRGRMSIAQKLFRKRMAEIGCPHCFLTSLEQAKEILPPKMLERR